MPIKGLDCIVLISVVFILQTRMDHKSKEEGALNYDLWEAINGISPYILPFKYKDLDCKWKCMPCRVVFHDLNEHWNDFHSETGPKKQSFAVIGSASQMYGRNFHTCDEG